MRCMCHKIESNCCTHVDLHTAELAMREPFKLTAQDYRHEASAQHLLVAMVCLPILRDGHAACRLICTLQS